MRQAIKQIKLSLLINGEKKEVPCYVIEYTKRGQELPQFPLGGNTVSIKKIVNGNRIIYDYLPLYSGFDIETTNVITDKYKSAFMYHWQFILASDEIGFVYLGRVWDTFKDLYYRIVEFYRLGAQRKLLVWDSNLGFEFQFLRRRFLWDEENFFAREERHPLAAPTVDGWDFREALSISGGSLAQLAKDYTTTQKLKGDLDYTVMRSSKTPLTETEKDYCINDVAILAEWSSFIFDKYIYPDKKIPLTKTGLLRSEVRNELKELLGYQGFKDYKQLVKNAFPDCDTYQYWFRWLFRGGYVHSNIVNTGYTIYGAIGEDETSAYPAWMNFGYYPGTPFVARYDLENFEQYVKDKCCIITVKFTGIQRLTSISYESKHKCLELVDALIDNGRVAAAAEMKVVLTELDYQLYKKLYKWERIEVICLWTSDKIRLPKFILNVLNRHYLNKAKMKKAGLSGTPEYAIEKSGVNAAYGLMVTRMELDSVKYSNNLENWQIEENNLDFEEEKSKQILLPQWGIWVTAHARWALFQPGFKIIEELGADYIIYNDTDSYKCRKHPRVLAIFEEYNKWIAKKIQAAGLTDPAFDDLGMFDLESPNITRIKTLGAKRYLTEENGKIKATVAGMPKNAIVKIEGDPFRAFDILGMELRADVSDKNTIHYEDNASEWTAPDGVKMSELSSAAIFEIAFTMKLDKFYRRFIEQGLEDKREVLGH